MTDCSTLFAGYALCENVFANCGFLCGRQRLRRQKSDRNAGGIPQEGVLREIVLTFSR